MSIIALTGYPRVGKDTIVLLMRKMYPDTNIHQVAYADHLKQVHMQQLGCTDLELYNHCLHEGILYNNINLRDSIADLSEVILSKDPMFNVTNCNKTIDQYPSDEITIITDMRYPIEHKNAIDNNHHILRVFGHPIPAAIKSLRWNKHIEMFSYDFAINNIYDFYRLYININKMLKTFNIVPTTPLTPFKDIDVTVL